MITYGEHKLKIQGLMDDDSAETALDILRYTNLAYKRIAAMRNWNPLTVYESSQGTILPGNLVRIVYVEDDTDRLYFKIGRPQRYMSQKLYNYFVDINPTTPLLTGSDMATTINSTTVTSATGGFVSATHAGEYIRIGASGGVYKISSVSDTNTLVLTEAFHGADWTDPSSAANLTSQYFEIRPTGTKRIAFTDENGDTITSSTIKMWYLREPRPLYNDYDPILLPGNAGALTSLVAQDMDTMEKYTNDALKKVPRYEEELRVMRSEDPISSQFMAPRDFYGNRVAFGRNRRFDRPRYDQSGNPVLQ